MSDLRVALIAEGPTDAIIIEAALKAILDRPFILRTVQPEPVLGAMGSGWSGVLGWCRGFLRRACAGLESDPTLPDCDLIIIHLDADVAGSTYAQGNVEQAAQGLSPIPSPQPCPPPSATTDEIRRCLLAWLGLQQLGPRTILCVPSKAIEAWLAAGVLAEGHDLLNGLECRMGLEAKLAGLPLAERIHKRQLEYRQRASTVMQRWGVVKQTCPQAERFEQETRAVLAAAFQDGTP